MRMAKRNYNWNERNVLETWKRRRSKEGWGGKTKFSGKKRTSVSKCRRMYHSTTKWLAHCDILYLTRATRTQTASRGQRTHRIHLRRFLFSIPQPLTRKREKESKRERKKRHNETRRFTHGRDEESTGSMSTCIFNHCFNIQNWTRASEFTFKISSFLVRQASESKLKKIVQAND